MDKLGDIHIMSGDSRTVNITAEKTVYLDGREVTTEPISLVSATVYFGFKCGKESVVTKSTITHLNAEQGESSITMNPSDTIDVSPGVYPYIVRVKNIDGSVYTIGKGDLTVHDSIIRVK